MTHKVNDIVYIEAEDPQTCEFCGKVEETRPYGPDNEEICFACGQLDIETTTQKFLEFMDEPGETIN